MQASLDLLITFVVQLFILVDPVAGAPVFLAITPHDSRAERRTMALRGCLVAAVVVWFFILAGPWVLGYFGIKTAAVRTCGGILLFGTTVVFAGSFVILIKAELLTRVLGKLGTAVATRIMGLVLAFLAVQYVLDGLSAVLGKG